MSEEAIQDILEQTESDPAFQALFDLFDYGKKTVSFKAVRRKTFLRFCGNLSKMMQHSPEHLKTVPIFIKHYMDMKGILFVLFCFFLKKL